MVSNAGNFPGRFSDPIPKTARTSLLVGKTNLSKTHDHDTDRSGDRVFQEGSSGWLWARRRSIDAMARRLPEKGFKMAVSGGNEVD
jgi:hypothetical protein